MSALAAAETTKRTGTACVIFGLDVLKTPLASMSAADCVQLAFCARQTIKHEMRKPNNPRTILFQQTEHGSLNLIDNIHVLPFHRLTFVP